MAELKFTSETGMFHSACEVKIGEDTQWYGFQPAKHRTPISPGKVDRSDRSGYINHSLTFEVDDRLLKTALENVVAEYQSKTYILTVCDCVSFSADLARQCRLLVPAVNLTPYGFLQVLAIWNKYKSKT